MAITTIHKYIDQYPILPDSQHLIIGTIHPHNTHHFNLDFFYGNVGSFWDILSQAFPSQRLDQLSDIVQTLSDYSIAITDMIRQCDRENEKITSDSALYNIIDNGAQIENGLRNSKIDTIYFTSRFGKNNAAKLFVDHFKIKYKHTWNPKTNEFIIDEHVFGRQIRAIALFSPSGQANIGISKTPAFLANIDYYQQFPKPVARFKLEFYQQKFHFMA